MPMLFPKNKDKNFKGVILAGGAGTRLHPLTVSTNKHLLSLYDKPVIVYSIEKLVRAGIEHIMVVTSPQAVEDIVKLLGSGFDFRSIRTGKQIQIVYGIQNQPNGLAYGLWLAKEYVGDSNCVLYLGDNIFEDDLTEHIANFEGGATVFLKEVSDPERFGVAEIGRDGKVKNIVEKPKKPKSNLAVTGLYIYDNSVFKKLDGLEPSKRGEYEITDVNRKYASEGALNHVFLKKKWFDIGTFDSLLDASIHFRKVKIRSRLHR